MTFTLAYLYLGSVLMSLVIVKSAGVDMSSPMNWIFPIIMPITWPFFLISALLS
jgi:hypothetical protein